MQQLSQEHIKRVLDEQEMLNVDLEKRRKKLDSLSKELNKREALIESEKQKLDEEKQMDDMLSGYHHKSFLDQKQADECFLRLVEEQKREKEEVLKKVLVLKRQLDSKQKLEMEIEELKGKLQVMKHMGDEDGTVAQKLIKKINDELKAKMEEMDGVEVMNYTFVVRGRQSNDELQEARKELFKREKEEVLKKYLDSERQLDAKQKLELEIEKLKGKMRVMKHLGDVDDTTVREQIKKVNGELEARMKAMDAVEEMNQTLAVKECQSNDEFQEAQKELIKNDMQNSSLRKAFLDKKADECVLRLFEEQDEGPRALDILPGLLMSKSKLYYEIQELRARMKMKNSLICVLLLVLGFLCLTLMF